MSVLVWPMIILTALLRLQFVFLLESVIEIEGMREVQMANE